jgi:hypothetical protein
MTTDIPGILDKAADLIDKHGRSQRVLAEPDGSMCIRGALMAAAEEPQSNLSPHPTTEQACDVIADALGLDYSPSVFSAYDVQKVEDNGRYAYTWTIIGPRRAHLPSNAVARWNMAMDSDIETTSTLREIAAKLRLEAQPTVENPIKAKPAPTVTVRSGGPVSIKLFGDGPWKSMGRITDVDFGVEGRGTVLRRDLMISV